LDPSNTTTACEAAGGRLDDALYVVAKYLATAAGAPLAKAAVLARLGWMFSIHLGPDQLNPNLWRSCRMMIHTWVDGGANKEMEKWR
jgi:hypothetical protein